MNEKINVIVVLFHIISLLTIWKIWKWKAFAHPGFYFSGLWFISVISEWYLVNMAYASTPYPEYIDELNIFTAFTSLCFTITSLIGKKHSILSFSIDIISNNKVYLKLMYVVFGATLVNFIISGATLSFGQNRMNLVSDLGHINRSFSILDSFLVILTSPLVFYSLTMGREMAKKIVGNGTEKYCNFYIVMPLLITVISSLAIGGRNPVVKTIKEYFLGLGTGVNVSRNKKVRNRLLIIMLVGLIGFMGFSTFISNDRAETYGANVREYSSKFASFSSGIMEYMSFHYWGNQLRRTDFSSGKDSTYGVATFYGLGNLSIPFSSSIGLKGNLWSLLGVDYDPLDVYKSQVDGSYTTSTIFSLLVRDFGTEGTFFAIVLIVIMTQLIFLRTLKVTRRSAMSLIPLLCVFGYWASSNFNSGFPAIQPLIIGALIFDLTQKNYTR